MLTASVSFIHSKDIYMYLLQKYEIIIDVILGIFVRQVVKQLRTLAQFL